jgi:hypothetical protein
MVSALLTQGDGIPFVRALIGLVREKVLSIKPN